LPFHGNTPLCVKLGAVPRCWSIALAPTATSFPFDSLTNQKGAVLAGQVWLLANLDLSGLRDHIGMRTIIWPAWRGDLLLACR
jgi:hypothetical protein